MRAWISNSRKARLFLKAALAVAAVVGLKFLAHRAGLEVISLNPLFSGIVAANVFLMGFLLSGVLADFKESERLPGELAACLEAIFDEAEILSRARGAAAARDCLRAVRDFAGTLVDWFHKKARTGEVLDELNGLGTHFAALESLTPANYLVRLKQEQASIRRIVIRIHAIRETSFVATGYFIAEFTAFLLALGLIFSKIDPFSESLFFVGIIVFLLSFLILLIRDLDNPFGFYDSTSAEDVSLKPLRDWIIRSTRSIHDGNPSAA